MKMQKKQKKLKNNYDFNLIMKREFCAFIWEKKRVDMYLSALFCDFSRSYIQKIIDKGMLKVNGKVLKKNTKIQNWDIFEIEIIREKTSIEAEEMKLDTIYEDENILIVNKDAWINVHPVPWEWGKSGTLVNACLFHCKENLPLIGGEERPWIVHRLDKDTSGIILIAKNDQMMHYLQDIIKARNIEKYYLALVKGRFKEEKFVIESQIGRDKNDRTKMTAKNPIAPRYALTKGKLLWYIDDNYSLLKIKLETGRTHQIRVHLASIGFPILWDKVYWDKETNKQVFEKYGLKRQALHAYELIFDLYGKKRYFQAPLKDDMKKIIGDEIVF